MKPTIGLWSSLLVVQMTIMMTILTSTIIIPTAIWNVDAHRVVSSTRTKLVRPTFHILESVVVTERMIHSIPRGGQYSYNDYEDDDQRWSNGGDGGRYPEDEEEDTSSSRNRQNDDYYGESGMYYQEDRGYNDNREMDQRGSSSSVVGTILTDLPRIFKTGDRRMGLPMLGIGAALTVLGVSLFFNKTLMRLGNLFFVAGVPMTIGAGRTAGYFLQSKKMRATGCLSLGIFLVFIGWPVFGIALEAFGLLNLFGNMFPLALAVLKTMPGIGPLLKGGFGGGTGSSTSEKPSRSRYSSSSQDYDDDDYYGGRNNYDRYDQGYQNDDGGQDNDDYNRRYY